MALFDKFFSTKRKLDDVTRGSRDRISSCQITPEQVRLLLFKECDRRGRKLLFDSSTIEKVLAAKNDKADTSQTNKVPYIVEVSNGFAYRYKGPAEDATVLGEMIFGAVAMNYRGVSLKIHIMDEPRRLMCTKVFSVPSSRRISRVDRKTAEVNTNSISLNNVSKPLNVPLQREEGVSLSFSLGRGDSGYYGDHSPHSSVSSSYDYFSMFDIWDDSSQEEFCSFRSPTGRKLSTSSSGSWQRRTFQNTATKFDLGCQSQSSNLLNVPSTISNVTSYDSQIYSNSSRSGTSDSLSSAGSAVVHRRSKLGLALLITVTDSTEMDMVRRCVEHSPQIQALVYRLRLATLAAGASSGFIATLYSAVVDAARWLSDLMYGPRLQPVWLSLVTNEQPRGVNKVAETLLSDLCSVLTVGDTKSTNFFISTLLTHILTYHLGWVTTVSPYDTPDHKKYFQESTGKKKRPYNALWAQLSDLCGSIGFPPRAARTIISGTNNSQFMDRLLLVLTYFVRCGDVKRSEFQFQDCVLKEHKVISVNNENVERFDFKRTEPQVNIEESNIGSLKVPSINTQNSDSSIVSTLVSSEVSMRRSATLANLSPKLSYSSEFAIESNLTSEKPTNSQIKRSPTVILPMKTYSNSSLSSSISEESDADQKVVFVLGDDEKLIGLKNKSISGKSVKKSTKVQNESMKFELEENENDKNKTVEIGAKDSCDDHKLTTSFENPSKCCGQTLQHSKPIKHSGFKFEFDKYPQIVTNYMKSKNLEILDRHYIGKPGNLKLDNFQFDPTIVPPIQEERCETCYKCQLMESMLQTPTNASELEYMNDVPRQSELQFAKETIVQESEKLSDISPKTYIRKRKENTLVVNLTTCPTEVIKPSISIKLSKFGIDKDNEENEKVTSRVQKIKEKTAEVKQILEFPMSHTCMRPKYAQVRSGFDASLLGGVTDHYVPDLILQGTTAKCSTFEAELRRDLDVTSYLNRTLESPVPAVAIIGDTNTWDVRVVGRECGAGAGGGGGGGGAGGMSALVGGMLDALPAMRRARVPAHLCLYFLESKMREFCVLSKTLADMLMSTDFCDIATLTKSLNIDINDVPFLLAVATTHTPQVATRYGISYR